MKKSRRFHVFVLILALIFTMGLGVANAQKKCGPKVDNFILFVDQSGSMYMTNESMKRVKMGMAKELLLGMNELIPQLSYKGGVVLFAPFQQLLAPTPFDRAQVSKAINTIKNEQDIFGRLTPMGPGLMGLDPVMSGLSGKTAVIIFSDGMANLGSDPVAEAKNLRSKYPNLCFHIVSFAEPADAKGKKILEAISKMDGCSIMVDGPALLKDKAALAKFVDDVFCAPVAEAKEEAMILRGINFDFDKSDIKPEFRPVLDEAVATLQKKANVNVIIEGHTDAIGSDAYNMKLSERRAKAVHGYFLKKGLAAGRMKTIGYGESKPKADNATEQGRAINRRVELKVVQ